MEGGIRLRKSKIVPPKKVAQALSRRELIARLSEAEEILHAIRSGEVDAIVVNGRGGEKVFTLQGADHTYRAFVERMNEGAAVHSSTHIVLHVQWTFCTVPRKEAPERDRCFPDGLRFARRSSQTPCITPASSPKELSGRDPFATAQSLPYVRPSLLESSSSK